MPPVEDVEGLLEAAREADGTPFDAIGEGEQHRAEISEDQVSALSLDGPAIHESVLAVLE